jgi:hypothetical protein
VNKDLSHALEYVIVKKGVVHGHRGSLYLLCNSKNIISSSSYYYSSGHEVRPINDLFGPHYCIRLVVSLMVVHVFVFRWVDSQGVVLGT